MSNYYTAKTTKEQRYTLFKTWETTGSVIQACEEANVSRSTFYHWKERFMQDGYAALEVYRSHAPKNPRRLDSKIAEEIVQLKKKNPKWGKRRIAEALITRKSVNSISANTVRRVLMDANMWPQM